MELKGSQTEKNLMAAFSGESEARNKYTYFASKARKEGYEQIAAIFEETALNEKEHAKIWFKLLNGGEIKSENVGIYLDRETYYGGSATVNVNGGHIEGKTYGIQQVKNNYTTNIGNLKYFTSRIPSHQGLRF